MYRGVAGNLFAYACKLSFEYGFGGYVVFESKTLLIDHYISTLGAKRAFGNRLFLDTEVAKTLVIRYFG